MHQSRRSNLKLRARRAAAYAKTPVHWTPSIPTVLSILFIVEILALAVFPELIANSLFIAVVGLSIPFGGWLFVYWKIYLSVFTSPYGSPTEITDPRWHQFNFLGWGGEQMEAFMLKSETQSKDLALYLHGYGSNLGRGETRCQHLASFGMNIVSLDQRGFGKQTGRLDWTLLKVIADAEALLDAVPQQLGFTPDRLLIYGHSMGGFITIRLASHQSGWWEGCLMGIILESPVTSFPKIINEKLPGRMVMSKPWVRHVLRREYERIHPDLNVRYANSELPFWGLPGVPILTLQSDKDEVLGRDHFDLLVEHLGPNKSADSQIFILDVPHTSEVDMQIRRDVVDEWLGPRLTESKEDD